MSKNIDLDKILSAAKKQVNLQLGENEVKSALMFFLGEDGMCNTNFGSPTDILALVSHIKQKDVLEQIAKKSINLCLELVKDMPDFLKKSLQAMTEEVFKDIHEADRAIVEDLEEKDDSSEVA